MSPLSNMISIIKVGYNARHTQVIAQNSKLCIGVLSVLYRLGYIRGFAIKSKKDLCIFLKYLGNKSVIRNINVVSTPGRRTYIRSKGLVRIVAKGDSGILIVSTSRGLLTDEESIMFNLGGEVLVKIS